MPVEFLNRFQDAGSHNLHPLPPAYTSPNARRNAAPTALHAPLHPPPLDRLLRQLHPLHPASPRRRRLRPRRSRPRDAPPPRLRHPLRQRHPLPREGAAPLLVHGRLHARLPALRIHLAPRPHRRRPHPSLPLRPRPRPAPRSLRPPPLPHHASRPLRRPHYPLQLRYLHLHPHQHPRRDALPLHHPCPLLLLAHRGTLRPPTIAPTNPATIPGAPGLALETWVSSRPPPPLLLRLRRRLRPQRPHQGPHRPALPARHRHPLRPHRPRPPSRPRVPPPTPPILIPARLPAPRRSLAHPRRPRQPHPRPSNSLRLRAWPLARPPSRRRQRSRLVLVLLHERAPPPLSQPPRPPRLRHLAPLALLGSLPHLAHALVRLRLQSHRLGRATLRQILPSPNLPQSATPPRPSSQAPRTSSPPPLGRAATALLLPLHPPGVLRPPLPPRLRPPHRRLAHPRLPLNVSRRHHSGCPTSRF